jgi:hypothetical protein
MNGFLEKAQGAQEGTVKAPCQERHPGKKENRDFPPQERGKDLDFCTKPQQPAPAGIAQEEQGGKT